MNTPKLSTWPIPSPAQGSELDNHTPDARRSPSPLASRSFTSPGSVLFPNLLRGRHHSPRSDPDRHHGFPIQLLTRRPPGAGSTPDRSPLHGHLVCEPTGVQDSRTHRTEVPRAEQSRGSGAAAGFHRGDRASFPSSPLNSQDTFLKEYLTSKCGAICFLQACRTDRSPNPTGPNALR